MTHSEKTKPLLAPGLKFQYYQNNTPEGSAAMVKQLRRTILWNTAFMQVLRKIIHAMMQKWMAKSC